MMRRGMFTSKTRGLCEGVRSVRKVSAVQNLRGESSSQKNAFPYFIWWEVGTSLGAKGFTIDRSIVWSLRGKMFKSTSLPSFKLLPPNALLVVMCRDDHWKKQRLTWHKLWGWNVKDAFHWSGVWILDGRQIIWLAGWIRFKVDQI